MLLASKAGGYMDNAVLAVDGGRNMVRPEHPPFIPLITSRDIRGEELINRSLGSMMVYPYLMRRISYQAWSTPLEHDPDSSSIGGKGEKIGNDKVSHRSTI
jgi:hypothetical protein